MDLKKLYEVINLIWKHMKATANLDITDLKQMQVCSDSEHKVLAQIENKDLQQMAMEWLASWERFLERRNKNENIPPSM